VGGQGKPGQFAVFADRKPYVAPVQGLALPADKESVRFRLHLRADRKPGLSDLISSGLNGCVVEGPFLSRATCNTRLSMSTQETFESAGLRHAQPVAEHQEQKAVVAAMSFSNSHVVKCFRSSFFKKRPSRRHISKMRRL